MPAPLSPFIPDLRRRRWLAGSVALAAGAALPAARACEVQAEFLRVMHPWSRATAPDASTAVLCMTLDQVTRDDLLIGAETPIARGAELVLQGEGQPQALALAVPAGGETVLDDQGTHVRLTGLLTPLHVGRSYPLTLHFRESGVVFAQLNVDFVRFR